MKCVMCGSPMDTRRGEYNYESLPGITLCNVLISTCPNCGEEEVGIPRVEELNHLLASVVRQKEAALTPHEARFLRMCSGLSKKDLATWFGRGEADVAAWESGQEGIPTMIDVFLRIIVMLDAPEMYKDANPARITTALQEQAARKIDPPLAFAPHWCTDSQDHWQPQQAHA